MWIKKWSRIRGIARHKVCMALPFSLLFDGRICHLFEHYPHTPIQRSHCPIRSRSPPLQDQILASLANESDEQLSPKRLSMSDAVAELMLTCFRTDCGSEIIDIQCTCTCIINRRQRRHQALHPVIREVSFHVVLHYTVKFHVGAANFGVETPVHDVR